MSVEVSGMVWKSGLPKNQKMTLLAYADHANDAGESVYPGEEWMAEKTSDSPGNVRRVTKILLEDGVLVQTKRGHRGQRAEFRIDLKRLAAHIARHSEEREAARTERDRRAESVDRRALRSVKARATATPNVSEPSEPSVNRQVTKKERDDLWDSLVAIYGEPSHRQMSSYGKAVTELVNYEATPDEVVAKSMQLVLEWGTKAATVPSLLKWWTRFDSPIASVTDSELDGARRRRDLTAKQEAVAVGAVSLPDDHPATVAKRRNR